MSVPPRTARYIAAGPHGESNTGPYRHEPAATFDRPGGNHGISRTTGSSVATAGPATTKAAESDPDEQRLSLSATQVLASMAAAVTAAFLGSRLGVAGTVIGAGLASVVTVVGSAVFGHSLLVTRKQVKKAVRQVRHADERAAEAPTAVISPVSVADDRTTVIPAVTRYDLERARLAAATAGTHPDAESTNKSDRQPKKTRRRIGTGLLVGVAATAAIFAGSLAAVTVVETVKGSPLSGGDSGGLSVLGGGESTDPATIPTSAPTSTEVSTVTATVTSPVSTSEATEPTKSSSATTASSSGPSPTASSDPTGTSAPSSSVNADRTTANATTGGTTDGN